MAKQSEKARRDKIAADVLGITVEEFKALRVAEQTEALTRKAASKGLSVPAYLAQRRNQRKTRNRPKRTTPTRRPKKPTSNATGPASSEPKTTGAHRPLFDPIPRAEMADVRCSICGNLRARSSFARFGKVCAKCQKRAQTRSYRIRIVSGGAPGLGRRR